MKLSKFLHNRQRSNHVSRKTPNPYLLKRIGMSLFSHLLFRARPAKKRVLQRLCSDVVQMMNHGFDFVLREKKIRKQSRKAEKRKASVHKMNVQKLTKNVRSEKTHRTR